MVQWKAVLPLLIFYLLVFYEERASTPSCVVVPQGGVQEAVGDDPEDLKVMVVANLLLLGSKAGYLNLFFRDFYLSKFFKKSFASLKPDMLLVLGDISAEGSDLTRSEWIPVLHQFRRMLGPFLALPFYVILGDRDVGECNQLNAKSVYWVAKNFPGLDSAGCGAFEVSNISFVSLNAVALLCGNNGLRFSVEKVIERESIDLQMDIEGTTEELNELKKFGETSHNLEWRENAMSSGSGPVLLLHFPLHHTSNCSGDGVPTRSYNSLFERTEIPGSRQLVGTGPYELLHTLPPNATEYIFQALRPRIVFSAHSHRFCDRTHPDGTREVTVPAMTWNAGDDPGFVVATFRKNRGAVIISHCSLARESHILIAYISLLILFMSMIFVAKQTQHI
ncbi:hypothetical protein AAG906_030278 [Vitis piasezkii]|uniref:Calcineurin-like phosphoesterase domain-containing protein n=2 Tax=Vitis vinifera TaxID=29760 RepID=A0ABY9DPC6_VITVI|nr:uncharacterized protein LOC100260752 [Vitis vinifera]XP_034676927.1 metallophosphoesterase 1-like isoform X1 [Vitis riparia]RVW65519.1 Metallophosphoesterase 1 [Vitis vinifera]WKA09550.1 hypothetical protein VitviT2T_027183 [Vitis vinifera]|eukprot:XP_010664311.1 PREDICTED: metallophosphoesterase 1 [Vitis vinifera]